jgi:UDP-N-acetylmuramate dehydrogenase
VSDARYPGFIARLAEAIRGQVREAEPLARHSTYRIGGPATMALPGSPEDVGIVLRLAAEADVAVLPLGLGSNVLLPDEPMEALVLRLGKGVDRVEAAGDIWRFGAGLPAPLAARRTADAGWAGLHLMVGVPGSVGGGVYMNAGCHGGQWSDVVTRVTAVDRAGTDRVLAAADIPFGYRRSGLGDLVVVEAEVRLLPGERERLTAEVHRLFDWRQRGTPFNQPCCGSVFQNPEWSEGPPSGGPRTAGQLIEACGLKGHRSGGAEVSPLHANYFVNTGGATAADVRRLMAYVQGTVWERFGVLLRPEVKVVGVRGDVVEV